MRNPRLRDQDWLGEEDGTGTKNQWWRKAKLKLGQVRGDRAERVALGGEKMGRRVCVTGISLILCIGWMWAGL